ncbi:hypothetical protein ABIA00_006112 [Bradyrhizobium ottawaense]|uniref:hypothetical protein n=1 Tax=Bradyrhizobium ottawaense TaxID=931866 RepID=UPI0038326B0A
MTTKNSRLEMKGLIALLDEACKADVAKHKKPASRSARLKQAEKEVKDAKPRDRRLVFKEMDQ